MDCIERMNKDQNSEQTEEKILKDKDKGMRKFVGGWI